MDCENQATLCYQCNLIMNIYIYAFILCNWCGPVIYWPSTELSIKRCTCVNKRKNSGSRWTINNNITRCTDGSSQLGTRSWIESQRQREGFRPSVTPGWATPAKMRKKCCNGREKNLGQYNCLSLSQAHLSHTTNITLSRIECERLYLYKEVCSFVIEVVIYG